MIMDTESRPGAPLGAARAPETPLFADGGPIERLLDRFGLEGGDKKHLVRRVIAALAVAWLPLLVLTAIDGRLWDGVSIPLLRDADANVRLLIALPALLVADYVLRQRFPGGMVRLQERRLLAPDDLDAFEASLMRVRRLAQTGWIDIVLLVLVILGDLAGREWHPSTLAMDTWYADLASEGGFDVRPAGLWMGWISLSLVQYVMLRWCARLAYWWYLVWKLSRMPLRVQPLNPDRSGGFGFLGGLTTAFMPWLFALGALASGWISNQLLYRGATFADFKYELLALACVSVLLVVGPLLFCMRPLVLARRLALGNYGTLANRYAEQFTMRWLAARNHPPSDLLGNGDFQSLADMAASFDNVKGMRMLPVGTGTITILLLTVVAPSAPLLLTMFSADELLERMLKMIF